jgi:hypothetical protein
MDPLLTWWQHAFPRTLTWPESVVMAAVVWAVWHKLCQAAARRKD